jgi:hypothetical protein
MIATERTENTGQLRSVMVASSRGVSKPTMIRIERGDSKVAIGAVLEAAVLTGVPLFDPDPNVQANRRTLQQAELALLPRAVRQRKVDDDF